MIQVTLGSRELLLAAEVGAWRHIESRRSALTNKVGYEGFGWHTDVEAACAEIAVARALNLYWSGAVDGARSKDVGFRYQVRHTTRPDGCLILRETDAAEDIYILVTGASPSLVIRGWVEGYEGKAPSFWKVDVQSPAWFVPQSALYRMENLPREET